MKKFLPAIFAFIFALAISVDTAFADLNVTSFSMGARAWEEPFGHLDDDMFVLNPPALSDDYDYFATIGQTSSDVEVHVEYDGNVIELTITAQHDLHHNTGNDQSWSQFHVGVVLEPTAPVNVSAVGSVAYDFSTWDTDMSAGPGLEVEIARLPTQELLFRDIQDPYLFPGAGVATIDQSYVLPGNEIYVIGLDGGLFNEGGDNFSNLFATGSSQAVLRLALVPEPSTAALAFVGLAFLKRPRR